MKIQKKGEKPVYKGVPETFAPQQEEALPSTKEQQADPKKKLSFSRRQLQKRT